MANLGETDREKLLGVVPGANYAQLTGDTAKLIGLNDITFTKLEEIESTGLADISFIARSGAGLTIYLET